MQIELNSDVAHLASHVQTYLATHQVVASCVSSIFLLDKITRESHHTCHLLQNKFALGW